MASNSFKKILLLATISTFVNACSIVPVKPWEKGTLAQDIVKFGGPNPMMKKFEEHIFTSKEASKGGGGVSGGGCGCN